MSVTCGLCVESASLSFFLSLSLCVSVSVCIFLSLCGVSMCVEVGFNGVSV